MPTDTSFLSPVWREGIFDNRVVFVTGGAGDICSAQTKALVYLGADAFILGRNPTKTEQKAREIASVRKGARVIGVGNVDVRSFDSLRQAADRCVAELGGIDFVIAGAAGNFLAPIAGLSSNAFKTVMDIDTLGTFNTIKATIDHLVASAKRYPATTETQATLATPKLATAAPGGRFLAISATLHYTGTPLQAHVGAAKAGVDSLVASVALEYGPRGVTANVLAPGPIAGTEGMSRLAGDRGEGDENKLRMDVRGGEPAIPSGRWGTVRDMADAAVYLLSAAGDYVNGHVLTVDGAAWRCPSTSMRLGSQEPMEYPQFFLDESSDKTKLLRKPPNSAKL